MVTKNKIVKIRYCIRDEKGNIIDDNRAFAPVEYLHGYNNLFAALENAMEGMEAEQEIQVLLAPEDAYGDYDEGKCIEMDLADFAAEEEPLQPGAVIEFSDGREFVVKSVNEINVTLDGNHPLAGAVLQFEIKVVFIRDATPEEIEHKHPLSQANSTCSPGCCC